MQKAETGGTDRSRTNLRRELALIPLGIALNLSLGTLVHILKLPVYVDAVGTIAVTLIAGLRVGVLVGILSFLVGGAVTNPVLPWFSGTQAAIAIYTHILGRRGCFRSTRRTVPTGIGLGVVAGIVSAPVIAILFGGLTGSGASLVVAFFLKSGQNLFKSVILSGLASEPLDKTLQCLLAAWLLRGVPQGILKRFSGGSLVENGYVKSQEN